MGPQGLVRFRPEDGQGVARSGKGLEDLSESPQLEARGAGGRGAPEPGRAEGEGTCLRHRGEAVEEGSETLPDAWLPTSSLRLPSSHPRWTASVPSVRRMTSNAPCRRLLTLAAGAPVCADEAVRTETEEGPVAVEALAARCAVLVARTLVHICGQMSRWCLPVSPPGRGCSRGVRDVGKPSAPPRSRPGRPEPLTLTHRAVGQLEARGTEALVGASRVLALASQAAALGVFTLVHICRATPGDGSAEGWGGEAELMGRPSKGRDQQGGLQRTWRSAPGDWTHRSAMLS